MAGKNIYIEKILDNLLGGIDTALASMKEAIYKMIGGEDPEYQKNLVDISEQMDDVMAKIDQQIESLSEVGGILSASANNLFLKEGHNRGGNIYNPLNIVGESDWSEHDLVSIKMIGSGNVYFHIPTTIFTCWLTGSGAWGGTYAFGVTVYVNNVKTVDFTKIVESENLATMDHYTKTGEEKNIAITGLEKDDIVKITYTFWKSGTWAEINSGHCEIVSQEHLRFEYDLQNIITDGAFVIL